MERHEHPYRGAMRSFVTLPLSMYVAVCALTFTRMAEGQAWTERKGEGSVSLVYQALTIHDHTLFDGSEVDFGKIHTHGLYLQFDYGFTDRLGFQFAVPYIGSKYLGSRPHLPGILNVPNADAELIDDGEFHTSLQDFGAGVQYGLTTGAFRVTPFVAFSVPSQDYTFFGHSAVGTHLTTLRFGVDVGQILDPWIPNTYFQARYSYGIPEEVLGVRVVHSDLNWDVGYFLTSRLSLKFLGFTHFSHSGLDFPVDFPSRTDEAFYHHDQTLAVRHVDLGGGFSFAAAEAWDIHASIITSPWAQNNHKIRQGITFGVTWYFRTRRAAPLTEEEELSPR
ncbi:MAG TPA: hypothetical protein VGC53_02025 [Vicinamibacteria bacterium]